MIPALIFPLLLAPGASVRISVLGDGKLRFLVGRKVVTSSSAVLSVNAAGLLADDSGRPVTPAVRISAGDLKIAMNGTVSVSGARVSRLVLERPSAEGTEIGFPGDEGFGVLQIGGSAAVKAISKPPSTPTTAVPAKTSNGQATVSIHADNQLSGDRILLGDVAEIEGDPATVAKLKAVDLGILPALGSRRTLSSWTVKAALRNQGVLESSVTLNFPPDVMVARKGQMIDADTIVAQAREVARETIKSAELSLTAGPAPLLVPFGEISYDGEFSRTPQYVVLTVKVSVDGKPVGQRVVKFSPPAGGVKLGDTVHITLSRNGAAVQTDGKAKSAGFIGESIQVVTVDGAAFSATVTASGSVEVKL